MSSQTDLKNYQKILKQFKDHFEISCGSPYVFQTCLILGYRLRLYDMVSIYKKKTSFHKIQKYILFSCIHSNSKGLLCIFSEKQKKYIFIMFEKYKMDIVINLRLSIRI